MLGPTAKHPAVELPSLFTPIAGAHQVMLEGRGALDACDVSPALRRRTAVTSRASPALPTILGITGEQTGSASRHEPVRHFDVVRDTTPATDPDQVRRSRPPKC
jgi:hypothetical protein